MTVQKIFFTRIFVFMTSFFLFIVSGQASASGFEPWTSVGSTGVVDDGDLNDVYQSLSRAGIKWSTPGGTSAYIRYNVTAIDGLVNKLDGYRLGMRFRDNGNGRVYARLIEHNKDTGAHFVRMWLDSNTFPAAAGFQYRSKVTCWPAWSFNFSRNAYYIEVYLRKDTTDGLADVSQLRLEPVLC